MIDLGKDEDELPVVKYTDEYEPEANFAVWTGLIVHQQALKVKYANIENFELVDFRHKSLRPFVPPRKFDSAKFSVKPAA